MIASISITVLLLVVLMIFVNDVHLFWGDRTLLGNIVILVAVLFLASWIGSALWQLWH